MAITASDARTHLFPLIQQVIDDHAPVRISSKAGDAVLMSADDYDSWQETIYLLRSPANARRRPARRSRPAMTAAAAAQAALRQIAQLTAKRPEGVTGVERTDEGWTVGIELVEDQRIPSSADILATYETTIDADGELLSYRRVRRYARGRGDIEEP